MPAVWNAQANSIFLQALEQPAADRETFILQACGDDEALREQVRSLLAASERAGGFLESPPTAIASLADTARETAFEPLSLTFLSPSERPASMGRLGHYEILEVIGAGGMGVVLKALDTKLQRVVAIKTLAQSLAASATARKRFIREAQAAAAVKHDNVISIYAVEADGPVPYLVMELVAGVSLEEKLQQKGTLELREILRIGLQIAEGLTAAHRQGLVHRDVKPANILLENHVERVKLTDFGLARVADEASLTQSGIIAGTPQYMAPEQAKGETVDHRADLFSLGSVLYALCTGRPPFRAETAVATLRRVCDDTPRPIREINPEIPPWLVETIVRLLSKQQTNRFQTAEEVADLLGRRLAQSQHPLQAVLPAPASGRPTISRAQVVGTIAALFVSLLGGLALTEATGLTNLLATLNRFSNSSSTSSTPVPPRQGSMLSNENATVTKHREEPVNINREADNGNPRKAPQSAATVAPIVSKELRRFEGHEAIVWSIAFSPDGSRALSGSGGRVKDRRWSLGSDFTVRLWDVASAQQLSSFMGYPHQLLSVAFTPDGRHAVGASKIWACRKWDIETGHELFGFRGEIGTPYFHLTLSADAARLLSWGGKDKVLRLWNTTTGTELWHVEGLPEEVTAAAFANDGRLVATAGGGKFIADEGLKPGSDYSIRLWNAATGKEELRLRGHTEFVRGLAFLPDGRRLLSAGADQVLRLWDLQTREELHVYRGHTRPVNAIALSSDGRWALSGSADMTVRLWDIEMGKELRRYEGHTGEVQSVALSPNHRYALSGGYDETIRLWQLSEPEE